MRMRRFILLMTLYSALFATLAPTTVEAAAGDRGSFGSRGTRTWVSPPATGTAPYSAQPFQRSMTPYAPSQAPGYANWGSSYRQPYFSQRSSFTSGLLGGLVGAGIGGLLLGHGLFGGGGLGFGGLIGLFLQIVLIVMLVRWLLGMFRRAQLVPAGGPSIFARAAEALPRPAGPGIGGPQPQARPVTIAPADYQAFERILKDVQQAWSDRNVEALRQLSTPEMASYFADLLAGHVSRGTRNVVSNVRLEQGDLAEAWAENGREYATVAMRFSMIDVTLDSAGRLVDGSPDERQMTTEIWTFVRVAGGRWVLSGIQQAR
jgi:predicted lipid-binding transport protein (Tim44 family)